ncbi:MAG: cardiolipin synthase [Bacteroidaceae bacterium]|nr:cardiolipin synthase [Bacteroidaceae bacterium]
MRRKNLTLKLLILTVMSVAALSVKAQSDAEEMKYLELHGIDVTEGNEVHLLKSGHDKFVDMFDAIRQAKRFVHLEYFNFRNDSIAGLLFDLLAQKVKEGVEVRAMYDAFGNASNNQPISRHQHDSIAALGIQLVKLDPIRAPWVNHIIPRDHRKIVVIDGEIAYTGGMNVADYYVDGLEGIGPWRDMHMHIEGEAVNKLHEIFAKMWAEATGEMLVSAKYFPMHEPKGSAKVAIVDRAPKVSNKSIRQLYVSMLDNARTKVRLINPYFVPTHSVRDALKRCIDRGVEVEIMISEKSDIPLTPDASHYVGRLLQKRGAKVYMFNGGFHHTKMMIVDDKFCTVGSSNLDSRSLRCDYEVNTVIFDPDVTAELVSMFENDKKSSIPMNTEYWQDKSKWKRFVAWFGNLLTPVL